MPSYIGGIMPVRKNEKTFKHFDYSDLAHTMSGRCALLHIIYDIQALNKDKRLSVYFPSYTCETVLAPFVRANFHIRFYEIDEHFRPHFENRYLTSDVLFLTGYYGFDSYENYYLDGEAKHGIQLLANLAKDNHSRIILDLTHSLFSANPIPCDWDYALASLRKWISIPAGGLAFKNQGNFQIPLAAEDKSHLEQRSLALRLASLAYDREDKDLYGAADSIFWKAEYALRDSFNNNASDQNSVMILESTDFNAIITKRRENYSYLLEHLPRSRSTEDSLLWQIAFPVLKQTACPSHFTILTDYQQELKDFFEAKKIHTKIFWPSLPGLAPEYQKSAERITQRVLSLPCDQYCSPEDMERIVHILTEWTPKL